MLDRQCFEEARGKAVEQLRAGERLSRANEEALMAAIDRLAAAFNAAWPQEKRAADSKTFLVYAAGKRSLQSMAASVYRLIETNDLRLFDDSYRFQGNSVVELVRHLCRYGLEFAPPEPGDEGTYKKLFFAMRTLYLELRPSQSVDSQSAGTLTQSLQRRLLHESENPDSLRRPTRRRRQRRRLAAVSCRNVEELSVAF